MRFNIPIALTLFRILLIPVLILIFFLNFKYNLLICSIIFIICSITDFLDGYLARRWNQTSKFGAFLDPVSDKLLVSISLILIGQEYYSIWFTIPIIIIISRELLVSALREWMAELGKRSLVAVSKLGKYKTASQMVAIAILFVNYNLAINLIGYIFLIIATVLTIWSVIKYMSQAIKNL